MIDLSASDAVSLLQGGQAHDWAGMIQLPGGNFWMGADDFYSEERPR